MQKQFIACFQAGATVMLVNFLIRVCECVLLCQASSRCVKGHILPHTQIKRADVAACAWPIESNDMVCMSHAGCGAASRAGREEGEG